MCKTVAIIEDDPDIRELLTEFFESTGYGVVAVPDGDTVRIQQRCNLADLFLIDLMLPRRTGIEVAAQIRPLFPGRPLLAMSASRMMLNLAAASGLFDAHFPKPFNLDAVAQAARVYAGRSDLARVGTEVDVPIP